MCEFEVKFKFSSKDNLMRLHDVLKNAGYCVGKIISWDYISVSDDKLREEAGEDTPVFEVEWHDDCAPKNDEGDQTFRFIGGKEVRKQVHKMIERATKPLAAEIELLTWQIKRLRDDDAVITRSGTVKTPLPLTDEAIMERAICEVLDSFPPRKPYETANKIAILRSIADELERKIDNADSKPTGDPPENALMATAIHRAIEETDYNGGSYGMGVAIANLRYIADEKERILKDG